MIAWFILKPPFAVARGDHEKGASKPVTPPDWGTAVGLVTNCPVWNGVVAAGSTVFIGFASNCSTGGIGVGPTVSPAGKAVGAFTIPGIGVGVAPGWTVPD